MLRHSTEDLPTSLMTMETFCPRCLRYSAHQSSTEQETKSSDSTDSSSSSGTDCARAIELFKSIQAYMNDRKLSFPDALIAELLQTVRYIYIYDLLQYYYYFLLVTASIDSAIILHATFPLYTSLIGHGSPFIT